MTHQVVTAPGPSQSKAPALGQGQGLSEPKTSRIGLGPPEESLAPVQ